MAYPIRDQQALYFLTFTVVEWLDVFTRPLYKDIVIESLGFCQRQKGLELFAYCLMTNHLHLIARAAEGCELSDIVRDFKKYTARRVFEAIMANPQESRRQWLEWTLRKQGEFNPKNTFIQLWQNHSHGVELKTDVMTRQKLDYIHHNPVRAGICYRGEDYVYSSAAWYTGTGEGLAVSLLF